jgi:hypothetical protein
MQNWKDLFVCFKHQLKAFDLLEWLCIQVNSNFENHSRYKQNHDKDNDKDKDKTLPPADMNAQAEFTNALNDRVKVLKDVTEAPLWWIDAQE